MFYKYVTDPSVLCGAERLTVSEGKGKGMELIRVYNGKLSFYLNVDRGLDIYRLEYEGRLVSYITKNGLVSPRLIGGEGFCFRNGFDGGFVYTCGLDNAGVPAEIDGNHVVMHGSFSYIPAENICVSGGFEGEDYYLTVTGTMKYTALFGSALYLKRTIRVRYMGDELELKDEITNHNFTDDKYIIQYHANFGYPFVDADTRLKVKAAESHGLKPEFDLSRCFEMCEPIAGCDEECFLHSLCGGYGVHATIEGKGLDIDLEFDADAQPYILQWKYPACGDYVLGVEPTTTHSPDKDFLPIRPRETKVHGVKFVFRKK